MDLNYVFERMYAGNHKYQVRLDGFFVCYANDKNSDSIDEKLKEAGFKSREHFLQMVYLCD